jgi:hypothetical protein
VTVDLSYEELPIDFAGRLNSASRFRGLVHRNTADGKTLPRRGSGFCRDNSGGLEVKRLRAWDGMQKEIADRRIAYGTSLPSEGLIKSGTFSGTTPTVSSSIALAQEAP